MRIERIRGERGSSLWPCWVVVLVVAGLGLLGACEDNESGRIFLLTMEAQRYVSVGLHD